MFRDVEISDFVRHDRVGLERTEAVSEANRNEKLCTVICRQLDRDMLAEGRRFSPDIHGNIEDATLDNADQLVLREGPGLVVQTSDRAALFRARDVILDKIQIDACGLKGSAVVDLGEEATCVLKVSCSDKQQTLDGQMFDVQGPDTI